MNPLSYIERTPHGTPDFPIAYYYVDETHPRYDMPFHWHREMELCHILQGEFSFYLNGEEVVAQRGDTVFIDQGVLHGGTPKNCIYICVVFDPRILLNVNACKDSMRKLMAPDIRICNHFTAAEHPISDMTYRLCYCAGRKAPGSELSTIGALFDWFGYIFESEQYSLCERTALPNTEKVQAMKAALEHIEQNYMTEITLTDLARQAGISIPYFSRIFRTMTHRTPIEYLTHYRIDRACELLAAANLTVTEIAYKCGFGDNSYFARAFKKEKGITPKQYQKQYR